MRKCTFLLPLHNNEGEEFSPFLLRIIRRDVVRQFGGCTLGAEVSGYYTMADGTPAFDRTQPITVCVEDDAAVDQLRSMVAGFGRELSQETMYFEVSSAVVEFVPAAGPLPASAVSARAIAEFAVAIAEDDDDPADASMPPADARDTSTKAVAAIQPNPYATLPPKPPADDDVQRNFAGQPISWNPENWGSPLTP